MHQIEKPGWKRKRWIACGVLWLTLPVLYPLGAGPLAYSLERGWVYRPAWNSLYGRSWNRHPFRQIPWLDNYVLWCQALGDEHARLAAQHR